MAIAPDDSLITALSQPAWREYLSLTKPKVSLLIVFTAIVGMVLASPGMVPLPALVFGTLGIAIVLAHLYMDTTAFLVARDCATRGVREGGHTHAASDPRHSVHAPTDSALHGLAHSMHADSRSHWHERIDLSGGRARARCALSLPGLGSSPRRSARPSHSNLPFLHHLPDGSVRCIHRRSLLQAALLRMQIANSTFSCLRSAPNGGFRWPQGFRYAHLH